MHHVTHNKIFRTKALAVLGIAILAVILWNSRVSETDQGQISLAPNIASASLLHADCESQTQSKDKTDCYRSAFETYMKKNGGKKTLLLL